MYNVETNGDVITVTQGQVEGKQQSYDTKCVPKNVGRSNETTGADQAALEATAKHAKKLKSGYTLNKSGHIEIELPMKVKSYFGQQKNLALEVYVSTKYNGVNGIYRLEDNVLNLYSRGGEKWETPAHHITPMTEFIKTNDVGNAVNVELFIENMFLQDITAAVKKHNDDTPKLVAKVFDIPEMGSLPFSKRYQKMKECTSSPFIHVVECNLVKSDRKTLMELHEKATMKGYEGLIIHNPDGKYIYNIRSSNVFKLKIALDKEFKVVGYNLDKNGHPVFICKVTDDKSFKVKLKGSAEERLAMAEIAADKIGEWLKVEYEMDSKDGIPQKPVGIIFRECDTDGNPIE